MAKNGTAVLEQPKTSTKPAIARVTDDPEVVRLSEVTHRLRSALGEAESCLYSADKVGRDELIRRVANGEPAELIQPDRSALRQRVGVLRDALNKASQDYQVAWQRTEAVLMEGFADDFHAADAAVRDALAGLVTALDERAALLERLSRRGIDSNRLGRRVRQFRLLSDRTVRLENQEWQQKVT